LFNPTLIAKEGPARSTLIEQKTDLIILVLVVSLDPVGSLRRNELTPSFAATHLI